MMLLQSLILISTFLLLSSHLADAKKSSHYKTTAVNLYLKIISKKNHFNCFEAEDHVPAPAAAAAKHGQKQPSASRGAAGGHTNSHQPATQQQKVQPTTFK
jgi:hypothetical protein